MTKTDYLIVGAGAVGMVFADQLLTETDADIVMVDRRAAPGGHWVDAYPFVRLHLPSAFYGAGSRELGSGRIDETGFNAGLYELASHAEILAHFDALMRERFLPSGRVRFMPMSEYEGEGRVRSRLNGTVTEIAHRKLVDTTYAEVSIPYTHKRGFGVGEGATVIPPNDLPRRAAEFARYTILGGSKTAMDAGVWLLQMGVEPGRIRWVRPREAWLINRATIQPGARFHVQFNAALADSLDAAANASDIDDLFDRLERAGVLVRIDRTVRPTMFRGASISAGEAELLATIGDVVRLGHVRRIDADRMILERGEVGADADTLYIDCTARAFARRPAIPVFDGDRITPQPLRGGVICLSAAMVAHVEAAYDDEATKNHLCPPVPLAEDHTDWLMWTLADMEIAARWAKEPAIREWMAGCRLTGYRAGEQRPEPTAEALAVTERIRAVRAAAKANLERLWGGVSGVRPVARELSSTDA